MQRTIVTLIVLLVGAGWGLAEVGPEANQLNTALTGAEQITLPAVPIGFQPTGELDEIVGDTLIVGTTYYDAQHNGGVGRQIAYNTNTEAVAFLWTKLYTPTGERHVPICKITEDGLGGFEVEPNPIVDVDATAQRSGYANLGLDQSITDPADFGAYPVMHTNPDGSGWSSYAYSENPFIQWWWNGYAVPNIYANLHIWPKATFNNDYVHMVSHEQRTDNAAEMEISYMRWEETGSGLIPATPGGNPVLISDYVMNISADVTTNLVGSKVAVGACAARYFTVGEDFAGTGQDDQFNNDLYVWISEDAGQTWNDPIDISQLVGADADLLPDTTAANGDTLRPYTDCSLVYDDQDRLHTAFTTQDFKFFQESAYVMGGIWHHMTDDDGDDWWTRIHYQPFTGVTTEAWGRTCDRPSLTFDLDTGILWCVFEVTDGVTAAGDTTDYGEGFIGNTDLFVSASPPGQYNGLLWTQPVNITNTEFTGIPPAPAGECRSETDPSVALRSEGDYLHIQYVLDLDAGTGIGTSPENTITNNPMVYHRVSKQELLDLFEANAAWVENYPMHVDESGYWQDPGDYAWDEYGGFFTGPRDNAPMAELVLTGLNTVVPPGGGSIAYSLDFSSQLGQTVPGVTYWTTATMPNGTETQALFQQGFTHTPFMDVSIGWLQQDIPGFAPAGQYSYNGYIGFFPNAVLDDSFTWTKLGAASGADLPGDLDPNDWAHSELSFEAAGEVAATALPNRFELGAPYPNPFNPTTTLSVSLPATASMTLAVYNVNGQRVMTLANGTREAGTHRFTFDASGLASGVYLVRATVPGQPTVVRKVMLLK